MKKARAANAGRGFEEKSQTLPSLPSAEIQAKGRDRAADEADALLAEALHALVVHSPAYVGRSELEHALGCARPEYIARLINLIRDIRAEREWSAPALIPANRNHERTHPYDQARRTK
jgi:hypothetical protein